VAEHDPTRPRGQETNWKLWAGLVALVILVIFVVQNSQEVQVVFLFTTTETPLIFALLIAALLGAVVAWLLPRVRRGRHRERD
jgi:uncharacterized integral membrane protein